MLLSLIALSWLAVAACAVAVCQLATDAREADAGARRQAGERDEPLFSKSPYDWQELYAHAEELCMRGLPPEGPAPRPHCESRAHSRGAGLRSRFWRGRARSGRSRASRCRQASPACKAARRGI